MECRLLSRNVLASDTNPYACTLTRAKLHAPTSIQQGLRSLESLLPHFNMVDKKDRSIAPKWVKSFFNPQTLQESIILMELFKKHRMYFLAGCLLHILHHQRPGFLSYPASHLVPYLRDRAFPREEFPEMYYYRDPIPRLQAKIKRVLNNPPPQSNVSFKVIEQSVLKSDPPKRIIDAVITSPPYLNNLDYARDNRLRLWFLGISDHKTIKVNEIGRFSSFKDDILNSLNTIAQSLKIGGYCVLVLGDVREKNKVHDLPKIIINLVQEKIESLVIKEAWKDKIPSHKRARRNGRATRTETIVVFQRRKGIFDG